MMDLDRMLGTCETWVRRARDRGVRQVEAFWQEGASLEVELEHDAIGVTGLARMRGGAIRVVEHGRLGFAYFTDPEDAMAAVDRARQNARRAPDKGYAFPAGESLGRFPDTWDAGIAALDADTALGLADDALQAVKDEAPAATVAGGGAGLMAGGEAIASSEGVAAASRGTMASLGVSLVLGESGEAVAHWDGMSRPRLDALDADLATRAADVLLDLRDPAPAEPRGRHDVVLLPEAVGELVTGFAVAAATGDDACRGKTVWSDRAGQAVAHPGLDIVDDPTTPGAVDPPHFDGEGLRTAPRPILDHGVLHGYLFDSWDACLHEATTTHQAVRDAFKARPSTGSQHTVIGHASTRPRDALIADIDDGFVIGSVLGAHTANPTTGEFSITAPSVWRVRKGALEGACTEIAIGGDVPSLLQAIDAVSDDPRQDPGSTTPALRVRGLRVSA